MHKLFSMRSIITSLKGIGVSLVTALTAIPFNFAASFFAIKHMYAIYGIIMFALLVWVLFFWGWLAGKFWRWD